LSPKCSETQLRCCRDQATGSSRNLECSDYRKGHRLTVRLFRDSPGRILRKSIPGYGSIQLAHSARGQDEFLEATALAIHFDIGAADGSADGQWRRSGPIRHWDDPGRPEWNRRRWLWRDALPLSHAAVRGRRIPGCRRWNDPGSRGKLHVSQHPCRSNHQRSEHLDSRSKPAAPTSASWHKPETHCISKPMADHRRRS
jgi:hypothetical protein